jgi:acylphosphatase
MRYKQFIISGKVQGIFFRDFVRKKASALGAVGYVRNLKNGDVEVVAGGDEKKLKELEKECRKGPFMSNVTNLKVDEIELDEIFEDFVVRF